MARTKNSRSAAGAGSIRQRPDGRWEGRLTVGVDAATGKTIRRSVYGSTQKEVRQALTNLQKDVDSGTYLTPQKSTVESWLTEWLETFCKTKLKPLSYAKYLATAKNHIIPSLGSIKLQDLRGIHVQKLYNKMIDSGLSPKTVRDAAAVLRKALNIAIKQGFISSNPCDSAELPKIERKQIKPLSDAEIPLFLKEIDNHPMRNAFALCLFAGLREGECLGLSWSQIDFENQRIIVNQQLQKERKKGGVYYISDTTKGGKERTISPPDIAFTYLVDQKRKQASLRLAAGYIWDNPQDLVFTNETGRYIDIGVFYKHFKKIASAIGRPDARPHDLRHTAATVAISSGSDIKSVQDLLGHATASFTLDVYAHVSDTMRKDTAARMQGYYNNLNINKA